MKVIDKASLILAIVNALLLLATSATIWTVYLAHGDEVLDTTYEGRIYLEEEDYSNFKWYLANHHEVGIVSLEALSSPNALVDFKLRESGEGTFPYPNVTTFTYLLPLGDAIAAQSAALLLLGGVGVVGHLSGSIKRR